MTKQEIFNKVAKHLLTQNEKSQGPPSGGSQCMYRSPGGLSCAVGCLIKDEHYNAIMEGVSAIYNSDVRDALEKSLGPVENYRSLLNSLQEVHDCNPPVSWSTELASVASENNLTFTLTETEK